MNSDRAAPTLTPGSRLMRAVLGVLAGVLGLALVIPAALVLVPFWIVGSLTAGLRRLLSPKPLPWHDLIEFHPEVGWKPRPNAAAHALDYGGDAYQFSTDPDGWRGSRTLEESDVVVFGDSHAFGCGVDDRDFFADLAAEARVKAIGAPAYSMVQPVLWMERLAPHLSGKLVVWLICLGNDLDDSVHPGLHQYRAPFARQIQGSGEWEIATDHVDPSRWTITSREGSLDSLIEICSGGYASRRAFEAADYLVGRARAVCANAGARLVLMTIPELSPVARRYFAENVPRSASPDRFDEDLPDRRFEEICARHGVRFVALKDHLGSGDYLESDFHWNPRGHQRVARLIDRLHAEASWVEASEPTVRGDGVAAEAAAG